MKNSLSVNMLNKYLIYTGLIFSWFFTRVVFTSSTCQAGSLMYNEVINNILSQQENNWYLNVNNPASCSGIVTRYYVQYYDLLERQGYSVTLTAWTPGSINGSYDKVALSDAYIEVRNMNGKSSAAAITSATLQSSSVYVTKGAVVGVYFTQTNGANNHSLPIIGNVVSNPTNYLICNQAGDNSVSTINDCNSVNQVSGLVLHAEMEISADVECFQSDIPLVLNSNYTLIDGDTQYGSRLQYCCDVGYNISGNNILQCNENGQWIGSLPTCNILQCPAISSLDYGVVNGDVYTFGSSLMFSCNNGYTITGPKYITCDSNGNWNASLPQCNRNLVIPLMSSNSLNTSNQQSSTSSTPMVISMKQSEASGTSSQQSTLMSLSSDSNTLVLGLAVALVVSLIVVLVIFITVLFIISLIWKKRHSVKTVSNSQINKSTSHIGSCVQENVGDSNYTKSTQQSHTYYEPIAHPMHSNQEYFELDSNSYNKGNPSSACIPNYKLNLSSSQSHIYEPIPGPTHSSQEYFELDSANKGNEQLDIISHEYFFLKKPTAEIYEGQQFDAATMPPLTTHHQLSELLIPMLHRVNDKSVYQQPESDIQGIYDQLVREHYTEIPNKDLEIIKNLGSGQFGNVDKGIWHMSKGPIDVAIKSLKGPATEKEEIKLLQEAAITGQFCHPNIVLLYGVVTVGRPVIILEYLTNGNLKGFLENKKPNDAQLVESDLPILLIDFSFHIASGMAYLSQKQFIHRDLAARNILISHKNICKIADFGMARDIIDCNYYESSSTLIPIRWTAPEAFLSCKYTTKSDVWSFGVVLYEIWSLGCRPFKQNTNQECIRLIKSGHRLSAPPGCPGFIYEMMMLCWNPDPNNRPSFRYLQSKLSPNAEIISEADSIKNELGKVLSIDYQFFPGFNFQ